MLHDFKAEAKRKGCILLVEDELLIRSILAEEMRSEMLCVIEAGSADEAWAYLQNGGHADLVFSDIQMPGSMDGLELTRLIKKRYPLMKIIITSGNAGGRDTTESGMFLPKPYSIDHAVDIMLQSLSIN